MKRRTFFCVVGGAVATLPFPSTGAADSTQRLDHRTMKALVVDIGGSHVKLLASDRSEPRQFDSARDLTPEVLVERVALVTVKWRKHRCPLQRIGNGYDRDVQGIEQPGLQPDARRDTSKRSIVVTADGRAVSSQVKQWKHFSRMRNGDGVPVSVSFFDPSSLLACHVLAFLY